LFSLFDAELLGGAVNGTPRYQREYCAPVCLTVQLLFRRSVLKVFFGDFLSPDKKLPAAKQRKLYKKTKLQNSRQAFSNRV
jgi:hypothetical protein